jgi:hypothetical protein
VFHDQGRASNGGSFFGTFPNFDTPFNIATNPSIASHTVTMLYRGASGATVSGEVLLVRNTPSAQCVITGTLFAG